MARKRKQLEADLETFFASLYSKVDASRDEIRSFLWETKKEIESTSVEDVHKTAKSYTLEEAVSDLNLKYNPEFGYDGLHFWKIEALADVTAMEPSECLLVLLNDYTRIYDRSSEAARRIVVDLLLCDCIAQMRGRNPQPTETEIPEPAQKIKVYCEVSFSHRIKKSLSKGVVVGGRVDHSVGFSFPSMWPNQGFHSLLLCVEAKVDGIIATALGELVIYLGSLRQSRIDRGKNDSSVYGVATDGFNYVFVTISHEGILMKSKQFDVNGDLPIVLGCLRYILEKAMSLTLNVSPMQGEPQSDEMDADTVLTTVEREDDSDSEDDSE